MLVGEEWGVERRGGEVEGVGEGAAVFEEQLRLDGVAGADPRVQALTTLRGAANTGVSAGPGDADLARLFHDFERRRVIDPALLIWEEEGHFNDV